LAKQDAHESEIAGPLRWRDGRLKWK